MCEVQFHEPLKSFCTFFHVNLFICKHGFLLKLLTTRYESSSCDLLHRQFKKKKKKEEVNFIIYGSVIVPKVWDARERMRTVQSRHLLSVEHVQIQRHIA